MKYLRIIPVLLLAACAQVTATHGSSFTDPAYAGAKFSSLVIDAHAPLAEREAIERSAVAELQRTGIPATASMDVVPPTRDIGEAERKRKIMNTGAAAVLVITPREKQIVRDYIPGTYHHPYYDHHRGWRDSYFSPVFYDDPPMLLEEPEAHYEAVLYTLPHYKKAWAGDFTTRGPTGMEFTQVAGNYGREIIEKLAADGLIGAGN